MTTPISSQDNESKEWTQQGETEAESTHPLEAERRAGSIDTVGGATLAYLMRTTKKGGAIAAIGVSGGAALHSGLSTHPFPAKMMSLSCRAVLDEVQDQFSQISSILDSPNLVMSGK